MNRIGPIILLLLATTALAQDAIRLRRSVRLDDARPITLGLIADLTGPMAEGLAGIVIVEEPEFAGPLPWIEIDPVRVREAIEAGRRINWGRITLSGGTCLVRLAAPVAETPRSVGARRDQDEPQPVEMSGPPVVRQAVAGRIATYLGVEPVDLRLGFSPGDRALLGMSTLGRRVEAKPMGSAARMPLSVSVYEGDRIVASKSIRVRVLVRRRVALARGEPGRGDVLGEGDVLVETRWLAPGVQLAKPEAVIGSAVRSRLEAGRVITRRDIEPPIVVRRGELVRVHCLAGTVVLKTTARALARGRDGELIEFESLTSKHRFFARMNGPGRAVTVANTAPASDPAVAVGAVVIEKMNHGGDKR